MSIRKRKWTTGRGIPKESWIVDYVDQSGKRRLKTFSTKKDADAWNVTAAHQVQQGVHTPDSQSRTVAEAWEAWIADCEANSLERSTIVQRRQHLALHVKPFIGSDKLSKLTMPRVEEFDCILRDNGRSLAMRRKVNTNLKTVLTFCQRKGWVAQNVAQGFKIKSDQRHKAVKLREGVDYPSRAEVRTLFDKVSAGRNRALLVTAVFTGLRASEARGLPWKNVDLDTGILYVRQRADLWGKIGKPKSKAGNRDIPLAPMVVNTLRQWRVECPASDQDLVFPNGAGNVESHSNLLQRFWEPVQIACGMVDASSTARYGFHKLRHVAASLFMLTWGGRRSGSKK